jgi:predicted N-acetyltransferase YhbS
MRLRGPGVLYDGFPVFNRTDAVAGKGGVAMQIVNLNEHMNCLDQVVDWIFNEFINGIRIGATRENIVESYLSTKKGPLPLTLLAMEGSECVGTVSLVENDLKSKPYTPWLASLYVQEQFRNRGIGNVLVSQIISAARSLGFNEIYLRTEHAMDYYRRKNWTFLENVVDEYGLETNVFMKIIA